MGKVYKYGVFGVGRIGRVHASIVLNQGHQIVVIGDEAQAAVGAAQDALALGGVRTFLDPNGAGDDWRAKGRLRLSQPLAAMNNKFTLGTTCGSGFRIAPDKNT